MADSDDNAPQFDQQKAKDFSKGVSNGPDAWGNLKRAFSGGSSNDATDAMKRRLNSGTSGPSGVSGSTGSQ